MASFRSAADRLYRRLLRLYPGEFRAEWGQEMTLLFRDRSREESAPSLLLAMIVDTFKTAPREHYAMWSQDVRYAVRTMFRNPGFTAVAALSLALGTGAAAAVFSLADALVLRPLPVARPGELLSLRAQAQDSPFGASYASFSWTDYLDYREKSQSFEGLAAYRFVSVSLTKDAKAASQLRLGLLVSGNFFRVLGVEPALGRGFRPEEEAEAGSAVVVLSHSLWTSAFGADPAVLGRAVRLNGLDFTVVGVAPERFTGVDQFVRPALFVPMPAWVLLAGEEGRERLQRRDERSLAVKGRLRPGVGLGAAQAELTSIARALEEAYPATNKNQGALVRSELHARIESSPPDAALSAMLLALTGLVLLIACANVANLLLSRGGARAREIAVRQAVGAGRTRLVRQLLTEGLVLALLGGLLGLVLAAVGVRFFASLPVPSDLPIVLGVELDRRVLLVAFGASLLSVLAFGLTPALQTTRADVVSGLKVGDAGFALGRRLWGRQGLVVAQVALSLVLLVSAAVLLRGFARLLAADSGFRRDHILMASFDPTVLRYSDEKTERFYRDLVERARGLPGVRSAALTFGIPLGNEQQVLSFIPEGHVLPEGKSTLSSFGNIAGEGYFDTLKVPLARGRAFASTDTKDSPRVAIVNEHLAETYWPGQEALGKRLRLEGPEAPWAEVVGVARTHKYIWTGEAPSDFVYLPYAQSPRPRMVLLIESEGEPGGLTGPLRDLVRSLDPDLPMYNVRTMEDHFEARAVSVPAMIVNTVASLGLMGLVLSLVGLYGLVAYSVSRRTREIGVRMALGARRGQVLRMVLGQGLVLALIGVAAGLVLSAGASRLLASMIQGVDVREPLAFLGLPPLLLAASALAALAPAARAARVDPVSTLRSE
jgi:putative ABC transport system permease protein